MINNVVNLYEKLRAKDKRTLREKIYTDISIESLCSMFKYTVNDTELEEIINLRLEYYLRLYGRVGFTMHEGKLVFGVCKYSAQPNWYGGSDKVIITLEDATILERTLGKDAVIIRNNILEHSETNIFRFAQQLAEVDLSQVDLLVNARSHPIILCKDDNTANVIRNAIQNNHDGLPITLSSTSMLENDLMGSGKGVEVLTTTDPQTATLFQYYSHYHLDLTARLYGMYGLSTFNTGKMAQTNDSEVQGTLASSMCIPFANYNCRVYGLDNIRKMFGVVISIDFGECWKNQVNMLNGFDKDDYDIIDDPMGEEQINDNEANEENCDVATGENNENS